MKQAIRPQDYKRLQRPQTTTKNNKRQKKQQKTVKGNRYIKDNKRLQKYKRQKKTTKRQQQTSKSRFLFFTGQQRPSTGKEARRQRSAKITADLENDAPVYDDDFYK